jgi:hypothetical protein
MPLFHVALEAVEGLKNQKSGFATVTPPPLGIEAMEAICLLCR